MPGFTGDLDVDLERDATITAAEGRRVCRGTGASGEVHSRLPGGSGTPPTYIPIRKSPKNCPRRSPPAGGSSRLSWIMSSRPLTVRISNQMRAWF